MTEIVIEPTVVEVAIAPAPVEVLITAGGPPGPQGPPGVDGGSAFYYLHDQTIASAEWIITHNLAARPNVDVLIADEVIGIPIQHLTVNQVRIEFNTPQTGKAICS